jgi:hypothetical protein
LKILGDSIVVEVVEYETMLELERSVRADYGSVAAVSAGSDQFSGGDVELGSTVWAFDL